MDYERRLLLAANLVLSSDRSYEPPPEPYELGITAVLKPHQIEGLSWLIRRYHLGVNVVLGDEMGLGKTLQAISFLSYLKAQSLSCGPFLVMCPLSVTDGWMSEFSKFCSTLRVILYVGDKKHRHNLRNSMHETLQRQSSSSNELPFDVLLTTYDITLLDQDFLSQIPWDYAVIDEAQRLKNPSSVLYNVLEHNFVMPRRLLLTGTPIQNNLSELWALMHFCMPSIFGTSDQFISTFKEAGSSSAGTESYSVKRQFRILRYILNAFMLRRTKALLVERGTLTLPSVTEMTVMAPLIPLQRKVYMSILRKELQTLLSLSLGSTSNQSLQNIVMQLRKTCSHPYLFSGIEPEPYEEGEHLIQASGKLIILDLLLLKLHKFGHRVLLFAQMTRTLDILQDFMELRKYSYERLDGSVRSEERFAAIRSFSYQASKDDLNNQVNHDVPFVFMISTRAGGVGLNLIAADTVIFYEQDWNPQVDKQALQRAHRIGQMKHVLAINLVTQHTIEEAIMRRAERKLWLSSNVVQQQDEVYGTGKDIVAEEGDMKSLIIGLHMFDPTDMNKDSIDANSMVELNNMTDKVVEMRFHEIPEKDVRKFEINKKEILKSHDKLVNSSESSAFDFRVDEASYMSWVQKFKDASLSEESLNLEQGKRRHLPEEYQQKREADKKKAEEKQLGRWEALGYKTLAVEEPNMLVENSVLSDQGAVQFVYGDCTNPSKVCQSEPAIIFSCVDNSGNWGHGGMFNSLANLSSYIPDAYHRAFECGDLHMGDLHLIKLNASSGDESIVQHCPMWVALAVVQSYNPRRKVPRSNISMSDLEGCLSKASFAAAQNSASIHMPRIGYQDGSQHSEWYTMERLLRKYASMHGINIYVYYYRRPSRDQ
ncbi:probable helicase CHR10 isoform X1 [Zingiber officinale]|uniref:probable helicase CHR10 isoform X1 n=2 Tax=Zingiber officinale TaxID=94328 RepID=UPI001C4AA66F|nr:probable helicase CHR10 isoform X1 [Zingiber officinale]XP_042435857.1 probable helicase CHR10 isoform X1 [Zingiber officinale]